MKVPIIQIRASNYKLVHWQQKSSSGKCVAPQKRRKFELKRFEKEVSLLCARRRRSSSLQGKVDFLAREKKRLESVVEHSTQKVAALEALAVSFRDQVDVARKASEMKIEGMVQSRHRGTVPVTATTSTSSKDLGENLSENSASKDGKEAQMLSQLAEAEARVLDAERKVAEYEAALENSPSVEGHDGDLD